MITYWKGNKFDGLRRIMNSGLGMNMVETMEMLSRNAFLDGAYNMYGAGGASDTSFASISASTDGLSTDLIDDIRLGMAERGVPFTVMPNIDYTSASPICITTPGVIRDLQREAGSSTVNANAWIDIMKYADPSRIIAGEVGTYHGVRFVQTPRAILYNNGVIIHQANIVAPVTAGDGAVATKVDKVRTVGQPSGVSKFVQVSDASGFEINDLVSIHLTRTSDFGVTNGVDFRDGTLQVRRVEAVDLVANTVSFDYPIMTDFDTDLGASVYGYITKGRHVHSSTFIGGMDGVVLGVAAPPRLHTPPPVDDFDSMYRFSWDGYFGYQLFEPEVFEVHFGAGSNRVKGPRVS